MLYGDAASKEAPFPYVTELIDVNTGEPISTDTPPPPTPDAPTPTPPTPDVPVAPTPTPPTTEAPNSGNSILDCPYRVCSCSTQFHVHVNW